MPKETPMSRDLLNPEAVFAEAIEIKSPEGRAVFLDQACLNDAELRRQVEKLIVDYFRAGRFLEKPAAHIVASVGGQISERPATVIGPSKLLHPTAQRALSV